MPSVAVVASSPVRSPLAYAGPRRRMWANSRSLSSDLIRTAPLWVATSRAHRRPKRRTDVPSRSRSSVLTSPRPAPLRSTRSTVLLKKTTWAIVATATRSPSATVRVREARADLACRRRSLFITGARASVPFVFHAHLAAEQTVDDDEVDRGEHHPNAPPDEADRLAVVGGGRVLDREAVLGVHGGQDPRVDAEDGASQHPDYVGAGREERRPVVASEVENNHADEPGYGDEREHVPVGPLVEAPENPGAHPEGGQGGEQGKRGGREGEAARDPAGAGVQPALGLDGDEVRAVHHECRQGQESYKNRVPVEDAGGLTEGTEVCPQRLEEVPVLAQRNAAQDVAEGRPEEDRE